MSGTASRPFSFQDALFSGLGADAMAALTTANCDVAVVLSAAGDVLDIAHRDPGLAAWHLDDWIGRPWIETVTVESREKIGDLLAQSAKMSTTPSRQVNHSAKGTQDLPVGYRVVSLAGSPYRIALGTDLRPMADMQQRLVFAQVEMERDYRKLRDVELRYRILFQLAIEPLVVVEGQTSRILEANEGAARLLGRSVDKLVGMPISTVFAKSDQAFASEELRTIEVRGRADVFQARQSVSNALLTVRVLPFREFGRTNLLARLSDAEAADASRSAAPVSHMAAVAEQLPDGIVLINGEADIVEANPAFLDLIRVMAPDLVKDRNLGNWLGGSRVDLQVLMANLREHGTMRRFSSVIRDELGGKETVEISAAKLSGIDGLMFGLAIREVPAADPMHAGAANDPFGPMSKLTDLVGRVPLKEVVRDTADIIERLCIEAALRLTDNNRASAADMLGLSRQSLYIKLKRYDIAERDGSDR